MGSEEQGVCCALIQFNEVKEVEDLIRDLPNVCAKTKDFESKTHMDYVLGNDFDFNFERYKKVLDYYQAQPHLIDPHLPGLLELLVELVLTPENPKLVHAASCFASHLIKVRGLKVVVRHLPHEVKYMESVLQVI